MELRDIIVTPILLILVYSIGYFIRPKVTDNITRKYFLPGLTVRIVGALAVGFLYQFYYGGGDTLAYHTHGSRHIWEAFMNNPVEGLQLLFSSGKHHPDTYIYSSRIWYFRDQSSFFVSRVAAVFDLFTFSSYSGTAILFAVTGFVGAWLMFQTFYRLYPEFHKWIAFSCLFVPTVFFWGSGIFKDTLTLSAIGVMTYCFFNFLNNQWSWKGVVIFLVCGCIVYSLKVYILMSFIPALIAWFFAKRLYRIRSLMLKLILIPFVGIGAFFLVYASVSQVVKDDPRYSLDQLAKTAQVTAYDIRYWTGKDAGSGYSLGELDGSFSGMLALAPQAINVSLFRPYFWEVRNPLMLLSALEGLLFLALTVYVVFQTRIDFVRNMKNPEILFCLTFSLIFAFAVGVSTYNFGTLSRYKIPLLPYYLLGIGLILHQSNRLRKLNALEETE